MGKARPSANPVTRYAERALQGKEPACELVRLQCARHLRDLGKSKRGRYEFRGDVAEKRIEFFPRFLKLEDGRPFELGLWQQFIVGSLFGWFDRKTDTRRYRIAYIEAAKGTGKTPMAAGMLIEGAYLDREPAAEIYTAAFAEDQALVPFHDVERMISAEPELAGRADINKRDIFLAASRTVIRALTSEHRQLDGKRVHMAILDEVHEHRGPLVWDKIRAGTKGRRNPLIIGITNSGHDRESVCWRLHEYSEQVLRGVLENDAWFAYITGLDVCQEHRDAGRLFPEDGCPNCDDWRDPKVWPKANPNLGVTIQKSYLEEQVTEAEGMPSKINLVKRLNFNIWTDVATRWLPMHLWDACGGKVDVEKLKDRPCYGGLDLALVHDTSAFDLWWPPTETEPGYVLSWHWCPEKDIEEREARDQANYVLWRDKGLLKAIPGEVTDFRYIEHDIYEIAKEFTRIQAIGYDRRYAGELVNNLTDAGFTMVAIGQYPKDISAPAHELERLVRSRGFRHARHPTMRWHASNTVTKREPNGDLTIDKGRSSGRIDGISGFIFAIAVGSRIRPVAESIYNRRGREAAASGHPDGALAAYADHEPELVGAGASAPGKKRSVYSSEKFQKAYNPKPGDGDR